MNLMRHFPTKVRPARLLAGLHYTIAQCLMLFIFSLATSSNTLAAPAAQAIARTVVSDLAPDVAGLEQQALILSNYLEILEEPDHQLSFADVLSQPVAAGFRPAKQGDVESLNFGLSRSHYWIRLHLRNSSSQNVATMLEIAHPDLAKIDFYQPQGGNAKPSHKLFCDQGWQQSRFFTTPVCQSFFRLPNRNGRQQ